MRRRRFISWRPLAFLPFQLEGKVHESAKLLASSAS